MDKITAKAKNEVIPSIERKEVYINGKRVIYFTNTNKIEKTTPLVLLPGWPISSYMYYPLMTLLGSYYTCYAVNPPGFGGSASDLTKHTLSSLADFLEKFRKRIINKNINLMGYSASGVIALIYASRYKSLNNLIVFSTPYDGTNQLKETQFSNEPYLELFEVLRDHPHIRTFVNLKHVKVPLLKQVYKKSLIFNYSKLTKAEEKLIKELEKETHQCDIKVVIDVANEILTSDFTETAKAIRVPTLVLGAKNDLAVDPSRMVKLSKLVRKSTLKIIPAADHSVAFSEPEKIAPLILKFLLKN